MSLSFKIKAPSGDLLTLQVDSDATFLALKNSISTIVNIPPSEMRIVCAGRILKNDDAVLADLGLTDGATLHVVRMAANSVSASSPTSSSVPPPAGVRRSVPGMPDTNEMRRILDNPMMRALFENPSVMAAILESDPRMQAMAEQNPDIRRMIRDPSFLRQISDAVRNPSLMDEMMRNQDRTLSNIESLPGGMAALTSMYNTVERSERAIAPTAPTTTDESNRRFAESIGANLDLQSEGPNENALPNPWAAVPRTQNSGQDPPFASLAGLLGSQTGANNSTPNVPPFNPFAALSGGSSQPSPQQTIANPDANQRNQQMAQQLQLLLQLQQLQQAMQQAQGTPTQQNPFAASPFAFGSAVSPLAPAPVSSAPAPPSVPPEERFRDQLASMSELGFTDTQKNVKALLAAGGNVDAAINYLLDSI